MAEDIIFGRRQSPAPTPQPMEPVIAAEPHGLSAEAESFRQSLAAERPKSAGDFNEWRRAQTGKRLVAWLLGVALLCPGALSFGMKAPAALSGVLEVAGIAANIWLRRERRRHLKNIADWSEPDQGL